MIYKDCEYQRFCQEEVMFCDEDNLCQEDECPGHAMPCGYCEEEVWQGWMCLDGGEVFCEDCMYIEVHGDEEAKTQENKLESMKQMSRQKELEIDFILWKLLHEVSYVEGGK